MKTTYKWQRVIGRSCVVLALFTLCRIATAQQQGVWEKFEVKERMTDAALHQKRNPSFSFSAKSDDRGMNFEMSSVWANDRKTHTFRGHVAWEWTCQKGPGILIPGEEVTIKGVITNLSTEPSSNICAYAVLGNWGFMKPQSGKSGDECAGHSGSATMIGTFPVPKQPGLNRDGTPNPFIHLTLNLHGGNETAFIARTITYKWTQVTGQVQPTKPPAVVTAPPAGTATAPQAWAEKTQYKVGEPIVVRFKNLPGFKTDWIGVYGARAYHANEFIEWKHTNGVKEGSMQFGSPRYGPGEYVFRIYENNGYKLLVQTAAFTVVK